MATTTTKAGPWNMTVFSFDEADADNPLGRLTSADAGRLPFGALELGRDGRIVSYIDTEPDDGGPAKTGLVGRMLFGEVIPVGPESVVVQEFAKGVGSAELNVVFDCAVAGLGHRIRLHLKISPILGTYWIFIKRLRRSA